MEYKLKENVDYELVANPDDESTWNIRILNGNYTETVLQYGKVKVVGSEDEEDPQLSFTFDIVSTPVTDLNTEDEELQNYAGDLLISIIENAIIENEGVEIKEV